MDAIKSGLQVGGPGDSWQFRKILDVKTLLRQGKLQQVIGPGKGDGAPSGATILAVDKHPIKIHIRTTGEGNVAGRAQKTASKLHYDSSIGHGTDWTGSSWDEGLCRQDGGNTQGQNIDTEPVGNVPCS
jgi:hypothetical protein